ncbi:mitochondrial ribosomal protein L27 precursor, putative [Plasmodium malariae]|uniref:Mitochondrial ribosomal protein L27, putative n=1 Tax=Plasmodium malariae TaxID=5858 RepID=A0A1C3KYI3_PLAMA|nr:mitochondrial ribosomal protein L27 precursor, putative [Plasmodium malariae]
MSPFFRLCKHFTQVNWKDYCRLGYNHLNHFTRLTFAHPEKTLIGKEKRCYTDPRVNMNTPLTVRNNVFIGGSKQEGKRNIATTFDLSANVQTHRSSEVNECGCNCGIGTSRLNGMQILNNTIAVFTNPFKIFKRNKMVKTSSYRRKSRSSPNGQGQKAKIGIKRLSAEYVKTGQMLVKQRKIIAFNYEKKIRKRNFKYYPGENVKVTKNTSLVALTNGRVKYTFHVLQNLLIVNILPEELDELKEEDLYRYRTEHVKSFEENRSLIYLRMKNIITFPKFTHTQYIEPPLKPQFLTRYDIYDNPTLQRVPLLYHKKK